MVPSGQRIGPMRRHPMAGVARVPAFAPLHRAGFNSALQKMRSNRLLVSAKAPRASFPGRLCARINHQALDPGNHRAPARGAKGLQAGLRAFLAGDDFLTHAGRCRDFPQSPAGQALP